MDDLQAELAALRARVEALEEGQGTVRAPFRVVDKEGRTLLSVEVDDDSGWGRTVRLKLTAVTDGEALTLEVAKDGTQSLYLGDTVELSGFGFLTVGNKGGWSSASLSATDEDCMLTLSCSQVAERPQIQLSTSEEQSSLLLVRLAEDEGVRRGAGIVMGIDQECATRLQMGQGGPENELDLSADEVQGGRMVLRTHPGSEVIRIP